MFVNILIGILIGIGLIMPGVSGGVIAVILNVYDNLVYSINNILKKPKQSIKLLFPIGIGICIGIFSVGKLIKFLLFEKNYNQPYFIFIGLILGSVPSLINKVKEKSKPNYILMFLSFVFSLGLFVFGKDLINLSVNNISGVESYINMFITGIIFSIGKVVPGISSSFILMLVGTYELFLEVITNPIQLITNKPLEFIFLILGVVIGITIFIKMMNYLLKKYYSITYSIIIGFVIGSVIAIYPGLSFDIRGVISIILLVFSTVFSYYFSIKTNKI